MHRLETIWTYLYKDLYHEDDFRFMVNGTAAWTFIVFWGLCGFFMFVDLTGKPKWMLRYKTQPGANEPVDSGRLWKAVRVAVMNHLFLSFPCIFLLYYAHQYVGSSCRPEDLPSVGRIMVDLAGIILLEEIGFYYSHRLAHWGPLYRHIHKKHHEWTAPVGVVSVYAHPLEHVICNVMPFTIGPILMRSHMFTTELWYTMALSATIIHHSGYHLPLLPSPEFHDYHHLKFSWNYGVFGLLDWIHGTDKQFRSTPQYKRNRILYGVTPMTKKYPNNKKISNTE